MNKKLNFKEGLFFFVTGLAGSGKTTICSHLHKKISKKYGATIIISGDDIRRVYKNRKFTKQDRIEFAKKKLKFCQYIVKQGVNIIYTTISLSNKTRNLNKKGIKNFILIFIQANLKKIIKFKKKMIYHKKNQKNIWGIHLKPEFPKRADILIRNDFKKTTKTLSDELLIKINNLLHKKI